MKYTTQIQGNVIHNMKATTDLKVFLYLQRQDKIFPSKSKTTISSNYWELGKMRFSGSEKEPVTIVVKAIQFTAGKDLSQFYAVLLYAVYM